MHYFWYFAEILPIRHKPQLINQSMNYFLLYYHIILNEKNEDFQKKIKLQYCRIKKQKR